VSSRGIFVAAKKLVCHNYIFFSSLIMIGRITSRLLVALVLLVLGNHDACAFVTPRPVMQLATVKTTPSSPSPSTTTTTQMGMIFKKKEEEDLSFIESRDMTREEMFELNKQTENVMQQELFGMTIFSLIISIPMLYLVWVGFFSKTAEMNL
jgi:hypothetical protein